MPQIQTPVNLLSDATIDFFFWEITETVEDLLTHFENPGNKKSQLEEFSNNTTRQKEWLVIRLLLKEVLGTKVEIAYTASGCPYLVGSTLHIRISHSHKYVLLALAKGPFGVDLEVWSSRALQFKQKFLSLDECSFLHLEDPEKMAVRLWSAKESCYKHLGTSGISLKNDINLMNCSIGFEARVTNREEPIPIFFQDYPSYVLTWTRPE